MIITIHEMDYLHEMDYSGKQEKYRQIQESSLLTHAIYMYKQ